jgi:NlpE N-terminal domain
MAISARSFLVSLFLVGIVYSNTITSPLVGSYAAVLPAADATGRVVTLQLLANGDATMITRFVGKDDSAVEVGKWTPQGNSAVVTFTESNEKKESNQITWTLDGDNLQTTKYDTGLYGSAGLPLHRTSTGQLVENEFGGVSLRVDSWLAKSVQGASILATPVEDAPELGGGAPAHIRFTFNGVVPSYGIDPSVPQILIFPMKELKELDPSVAAEVKSLQQWLEDKPDSSTQPIPVFPIFSASQVFRCHVNYLPFKNGNGVRFLTYYAQDVAPIQRDHIFYTFQGFTSDEHWYVSAFWPVTTTVIPEGNQKMSAAEYDAFTKQFDTYFSNLIGTLEGTSSGGFTPDLKLLDEMMQSLNVSPKRQK